MKSIAQKLKQGRSYLLLAQILLLSAGSLQAQTLINGSLEGPTGAAQAPAPWSICGGTPDTQIINGTGMGINGINTPASDGLTYIGMVSSTFGYIEAIGQPAALTAGTAYSGSVDLFRSMLASSWDGTGRCQVWGGIDCSNPVELLWTSDTIVNLNNWRTYPISFTPTQNHAWIIFVNYLNPGSGLTTYFCMDNIQLSAVVLPVDFLAFSAEDAGEHVRLNWEVAEARPGDHFEIEWSADARQFEQIGTQAVRGDTRVFALNHAAPQPGINYYRLRAVDANGDAILSEIRQVDHAVNHAVRIYPSPTTGHLQIGLRLYAPTQVGLEVNDASGRLVLRDARALPPGNQAVELNLPDALASGIYHLSVEMGGTAAHYKFSLQR